MSAWRRRLGFATAAATLALIFVGGLVTSTGSGLAVPDWPLSYGMLMPPMVGGVLYEHSHRLAAATVGVLTLALALWTARRESRRWVRRLAWLALAAVVAQGLLGGLTVLLLLPTAVSVSHACLAQTFLCLLVWLAYASSGEWLAARPSLTDRVGLRAAAAQASAVVFAQLVAGALMRHMGAGLAIPDFPLAFGRLLPPAWNVPVAVHFGHRLGAILVLAALLRVAVRSWRVGEPRLRRLANALLGLGLLQAALGAATVWSGKAVLPTTTHVASGAAVLAGAWLLTLRAHRLLKPAPARLASAPRLQSSVEAA